MPSKTVSVVVPVYYNENSLPLLFERLLQIERELLQRHDVGLQLVFVNDGSRDHSQEVLAQFKAERASTTVVRLSRNFGAVHASRTGFRFVTGDAFIILAADLQDPPELLLKMVPRWLAGKKFVIAVRASREDPVISRIYSWLYYKALRFLVLPGYPEGGFDMALMDRAMLEPMTKCSKNAFTPLLAYWLGYEPEVVSYHRPRRKHGRSGWSFMKKFKAFLDVMLGFSATPIRLISAMGVLVAVGSFIYGSAVVVASLMGNIPVTGYASVVSLVTFLLGVIIVMLGIIGEYLWRIFDEVNKRPDTVIDEVL